MAESSERGDLEREWWDRWWGADYSWEGLAKSALDGGRVIFTKDQGLFGERGLQDYWRRDPVAGVMRSDEEMESVGELIRDPDGKLWHLAHVPLKWSHGAPAKAGWQAEATIHLNEILQRRLTITGESHIDANNKEITRDGRAQFSGLVAQSFWPCFEIRTAGSDFPVRMVCRQAWIGSLNADWDVFAEEVDFSESFIASEIRFSNSTIEGVISFNNTYLGGAATFRHATFSSLANFEKVKFQGEADFKGTQFRGNSIFFGAQFSNESKFDEAKFFERAMFESAFFAREVSFNSANFSGPTSFRGVTFKQGAKFQNIKEWGEAPSRWSRAFFASKASGLISFEGGSMPPLSAFDGLHLESGASLVLDDLGYKKMTEAFSTELAEIGTKSTKESSGNDTLGRPESVFYSSLASGCRFLKKYFDSIGDKDLFQRFASFELEARMKSDEVDRLERLIFWAYRWSSDYGASIGRPLARLACSVLWFAILYWIIAAACLNPISSQTKPIGEPYPIQTISEVSDRFFKGHFSEIDKRPMFGALSLSAHRAFPFGAWDVKAEDKDNNMRKLLLGDGEGGTNFTVRVLATVQSIFSLAMIFLSGLAIRRRFKME